MQITDYGLVISLSNDDDSLILSSCDVNTLIRDVYSKYDFFKISINGVESATGFIYRDEIYIHFDSQINQRISVYEHTTFLDVIRDISKLYKQKVEELNKEAQEFLILANCFEKILES